MIRLGKLNVALHNLSHVGDDQRLWTFELTYKTGFVSRLPTVQISIVPKRPAIVGLKPRSCQLPNRPSLAHEGRRILIPPVRDMAPTQYVFSFSETYVERQ